MGRNPSIGCHLTAAAALVVVLGCSGDTGPMGLPGEQGPEGPEGPQGPTGNANVIFSDWLPRPEVVDSVIDNRMNIKWAELGAPELTDSIFNSGTVLVYTRLDEAPVLQLPYTSHHPQLGPHTLGFLLQEPRQIVITQFTHDNSASVGIGPQVEFRYVLLPGGVPAELEATLVDYATARVYLQIPD